MEKIPTAEMFLPKNTNGLYSRNEVEKAMIEFSKLHVESALKAASDSTKQVSESTLLYDFEKEILNSYPPDNIK